MDFRIGIFTQRELLRATDVDDIDRDVARLRAALQADADRLADADLLKLIGQVRETSNRLAVGRCDDVAQTARGKIDATDSGALGWRTGRRSHHDHTLRTQGSGNGFVRSDNADARCRDVTVADQFGHDTV